MSRTALVGVTLVAGAGAVLAARAIGVPVVLAPVATLVLGWLIGRGSGDGGEAPR